MKLYIYDHCPYCVRARMIFGLKNLPVETVIVLNDDEKTPVSLIGKKAVPILVKEDGSAMPESLDIVNYIDTHFGEKMLADTVRPEIEQWMKKVSSYYNHLLLPRFVQLDLPEYATQSALDYFIHKKTEFIGDFAENLAQSPQYLATLTADLAELDGLIQSPVDRQFSVEDIMLFPMLRNLTCVKGVVFPQNVADYVAKMAELSQIPLYSEQAL